MKRVVRHFSACPCRRKGGRLPASRSRWEKRASFGDDVLQLNTEGQQSDMSDNRDPQPAQHTCGPCTAACLNQGAKAATPNPASADHLAKIFPNRWVRASGGALFLTPISGDGRCC